MKSTVRYAALGELVWVPDRREALPIVSACENNFGGTWVCATHRHVARHNLNATMHEQEPGEHVVYWRCQEHGPEQAS